MNTDVFAWISQALDRAFVDSKGKDFDELEATLKESETSLLAEANANAPAVLEVKRGVLERLFVGAIQRARPISECLRLYQECNRLGFKDASKQWLITNVFIQYILDNEPSQTVGIAHDLLRTAHRDLSASRTAIEESLRQVNAMRKSLFGNQFDDCTDV